MLGTMKKKVNAGDYAEGGVEAMAQDFEQIISNCRTYNKPDTPYVKLADNLLTTGTATIEAFKAVSFPKAAVGLIVLRKLQVSFMATLTNDRVSRGCRHPLRLHMLYAKHMGSPPGFR